VQTAMLRRNQRSRRRLRSRTVFSRHTLSTPSCGRLWQCVILAFPLPHVQLLVPRINTSASHYEREPRCILGLGLVIYFAPVTFRLTVVMIFLYLVCSCPRCPFPCICPPSLDCILIISSEEVVHVLGVCITRPWYYSKRSVHSGS